ncbi:MAG: amino acid adenylation domain-containing protein [Deltaproteobacteria bacterium]|nr:amino acid adenylation domain-containing protein [Deltaproteobacteria bacterium]
MIEPLLDVVLRFRQRVDEAPERVAVLARGGSPSYAELEARVNRLARFLREQGVGPEVPVGVCVERDVDLIVGLMGVLASGGAYVPLDPEHPDARLARTLEQVGPALVLTHARHRQRFADRRVVVLDGHDASAIARASAARPEWTAAASDLACVIFTSGSTGAPSGVLLERGALAARYLLSPYHDLVAPGDALALVTAAAWAPSVYEITFGLARGATLALAEREDVRDPTRLARLIVERDVRFMRAVPSLWQALLDAGWPGKADLAIVCHGESLSPRLARRLATRGRGVWNTFGATEATVFARVAPDDSDKQALVYDNIAPNGTLGTLSVRALDLAPSPIGEPGEVHVGGSVLARGYLGDPTLTARRFPHDPATGQRLHATGDLARRLPDGRLALLGRRDHQVKIRGQRVALGEVEAALGGHPAVREAVVDARPDEAGAPRLVAWVATDDGAPPAGWRELLAASLPDFMLPSQCLVVPSLPKNAGGKVDRAALPDPIHAASGDPTVPSDSDEPHERAVSALFAEALHLPEGAFGPDDDFFALGGHSLAAARVAARINREHGLDLSIAELFETPTVRSLARAIALRLAAPERPRRPPLRRLERRERAALSFGQERLWFLSLLTPGDFAYNLPTAERLVGPLDIAALRAALTLVVQRHEALRSSLRADADGQPHQSPEPLASLDVPLVDLAHLPPDARPDAAREAIARASVAPFDLTRPPLLRAAVYALGPDDHVLFVNQHHVASDGWSKVVLRRELALAYDALRRGEPPTLPALPIQVLDHAAWQRATLGEGELLRQLAYWRERLAGLEPLVLPADRPRPRVFSHRGDRRERRLPASLLTAVDALARRHGASRFMVLFAAFQAVLHRYTGQSDLAVGTPIAGRDLPEVEGLVGFFVNTLVLRTTVDGDDTFVTLLARVKRGALEAYAHHDVPFERLVLELNPERDMGRHPLVQVVLALQSTPFDEVALDELSATRFAFRHEMTRLDVELHVQERAGGLDCHVVYSADLFDGWRMERLLVHLEVMLVATTRDPTAPIGDVDLVGPEERRLLATWNATARADADRGRAVHDLFAEQVARAPERLAVVDADRRLTYGELAARAWRLARHLRAAGVGEGARVGVVLPRSADLLVAIIAVLEVGAAWVPLDPDHPPARLSAILDDVGAALALTVKSLDERLTTRVSIIALDAAWADIACHPAERPPPRPMDPERLACVFHTSGSTGRPNGVEVTHRGLTNVVLWHRDHHAVTADDRATLFASPAFDASVLETWPYLVAGASLHVIDPDARLVPARLGAWMRARAITIGFLPPAVIEPCLAERALDVPSLRAVITGGERLRLRPPPEARFTLFNHYGPTEITVCATATSVAPAADPDAPVSPPAIGRPIANTRAHVLDARGRPAPIGVPGELYVGGVGVARGYAGRPELTAARFLSRPDLDPGPLYRTGDHVRWRPDGELEFLGRVDEQVKLRGVRVEPGEIDAALASCSGVARTLTVLREDTPGDPRLVTYVVLDDGSDDGGALEAEHVARWRELYDRELPATIEDEFIGWNSSLTGARIPAAEMREWVEATLGRVRALRPERVLELGCGRGLFLLPLAREVAAITGTDLSSQGLARIRARLATMPDVSARVRLVHAPLHDLAWLAADETYDTVLMSSVTQYLPSGRYLADVLERLVPSVAPGGRFVIADVRNLELQDAFRAATGATGDDEELLLAPAFFEDVAARIAERTGRPAHAEARPRRGRAANEMSMVRFDVTLHLDAPARPLSAFTERRWGRDAADLATLRALIAAEPGALVLRDLVDARLAPHQPAGSTPPPPPVAVEDLAALALALGRRFDLGLEAGSTWLAACFVPPDVEPFVPPLASPRAAGSPRASDPLRGPRARRALQRLRERAREALPEVMVPSAFVVLPTLPLTPNGKVDRRALPLPRDDHHGRDAARADAAPRTPTERALAAIFTDVLGLAQVGRDEGFFLLGGHSLLAVQLVIRIHERLGIDLPLSAIFAAQSVANLSLMIDAARTAPSGRPRPSPSTDGPEDADLRVTRVPLTPMDVNFHYGRVFWGVDARAWYQVLELTLGESAQRLDVDRLAAAALATVNRHPIARGRISSPTALGARAFWDVSARHVTAPLEVFEAEDDTAFASLRRAILERRLAPDEAPSCRFALVRHPTRDVLFVRYNHSAIDGLGLRCLVRSLMASYLGRPEPALRVLPFSTAELLALHAHDPSWLGSVELAHLTRLLPRWLRPERVARVHRHMARPSRRDEVMPARLRGMGGDARARGAARVEVDFTEDESRWLAEVARGQGTTLDRLFIAAIVEGASAWNRARSPDGRPGRVECYWAVNLRPPRYVDSVVANQFSWSRVRAPDHDHDGWRAEVLDPASDFLLRGALDWIRFVDLFHGTPMPDALRWTMMRLIERTAPTFVVSNVLPIDDLATDPLGVAFGVSAVEHHSSHAYTDRPVLVLGRRERRLHLRMIFPLTLFDPPGATTFLEAMRRAALDLARELTTARARR